MADFMTDFVADCVTDFCIFFVFQVGGEIVWCDISCFRLFEFSFFLIFFFNYVLFILVRPWITPVFMAVSVQKQVHVTSDFIYAPINSGVTGETADIVMNMNIYTRDGGNSMYKLS